MYTSPLTNVTTYFTLVGKALSLGNFRLNKICCAIVFYSPVCCVFWPVNGCSTRRLLVKIVFFDGFSCFSIFLLHIRKNKKKCKKLRENTYIVVLLLCWLTPLCVFFSNLFLLFFCLWPKKMEKHGKMQKYDFDRQIVCSAPACWSKYTTVSFIAPHSVNRFKRALFHFTQTLIRILHDFETKHEITDPISFLFICFNMQQQMQ